MFNAHALVHPRVHKTGKWVLGVSGKHAYLSGALLLLFGSGDDTVERLESRGRRTEFIPPLFTYFGFCDRQMRFLIGNSKPPSSWPQGTPISLSTLSLSPTPARPPFTHPSLLQARHASTTDFCFGEDCSPMERWVHETAGGRGGAHQRTPDDLPRKKPSMCAPLGCLRRVRPVYI